MPNGQYTAVHTLDPNTSPMCGNCVPSLASQLAFTYQPATHTYQVAGGQTPVQTATLDRDTLHVQFAGVPYTHQDGCPGQTIPTLVATLSATGYTGTHDVSFYIPACNGQPPRICKCTYSVVASAP